REPTLVLRAALHRAAPALRPELLLLIRADPQHPSPSPLEPQHLALLPLDQKALDVAEHLRSLERRARGQEIAQHGRVVEAEIHATRGLVIHHHQEAPEVPPQLPERATPCEVDAPALAPAF